MVGSYQELLPRRGQLRSPNQRLRLEAVQTGKSLTLRDDVEGRAAESSSCREGRSRGGERRGGPLLRIKSERKCLSPIRPPARSSPRERPTTRRRLPTRQGYEPSMESRNRSENCLKVNVDMRHRRRQIFWFVLRKAEGIENA